jgi:ClpP class serine protease
LPALLRPKKAASPRRRRMRKFREKARHREALAIQEGADLLDLLFGDPVKENEDLGGTIVVHIRGALEQERCIYGDSYEQIYERFTAAIEEGPERIILRINSPGGVVSGLNQCVYDMIEARRESGIPVDVYVGELCASAAYAIACSGNRIYGPPSCIAGSIGVISTMVDQVAADKKEGLNFVTITSGARKADGHPHVTISEDAVDAERLRVSQLADQFFAIVKKSRGIDAKKLQAGIFTGQDAVDVGVIDEVLGWRELLAKFGLAQPGDSVSASDETRKRLDSPEGNTAMNLKALIEKTRASLKAEGNLLKRRAIQVKLDRQLATLADLEAAKKTYKKSTHVEETEEDDPSDEEEEGGGGNDTDRDEEDEPSDDKDEPKDEESAEFPPEKKKSAKKAKASEEDDEESAEGDDKEEESAEMDDEEEKALRAAVSKLTGKAKATAMGALRALTEKAKSYDTDVAALKRDKATREKRELISAKLAGGFITKRTAKELQGKKLSFVSSYLSMQKTRLFNREDEALVPKDENAPGGSAHVFTKQQEAMFAKAAAASKGTLTVEALKEQYTTGLHRPNGIMIPKGGY